MKNLFLFLILLNSLYSQDKIIIDETIQLDKNKEYYEKKENLLNEVPKIEEIKKRKEKLEVDGKVGVNKETKTIDSVNINIGSKF
ncbi:hypothetical protein [Arcobacter arenosus]|uniref:Uncharacterized protein n=1 Tax=Arcobacter arenosus TaxID=2576037 RepID=A0A5R8Y2B6_9BACT|nr:hypothetical protein [Arcobacter arenosus]TLP39465.1 hypothetical protein FDK22_06235 [Arcobacter arenosus]